MPIPHPMNMNVEPMVAMVAAGEGQVKFCWVSVPWYVIGQFMPT